MEPIELYSADRRGLYGAGPLNLFQDNPISAFASPITLDGHAVEPHIRDLFPEGLSLHGWGYLAAPIEKRSDEISRQWMLTEPAIELIFEYVRQSHYPDSPSRFQSYFGFEDIARVQTFAAPGTRIVKLRAMHYQKADMNLLQIIPPLATSSLVAHWYWTGRASQKPDWEYLLIPPVEIVAEVIPAG